MFKQKKPMQKDHKHLITCN